ncbi:MAG: Hsp33 family molecular chaperone [Notoacmeibacter sp.]
MSDYVSPIETGAEDDVIVPFSVSSLDVRGRTGQFGAAINSILQRHAYPEPVAQLLAQALSLTALLGSSLKFDGKFIMQTQTDGPVGLLVADLRANGALRGYARFDADYFAASQPPKMAHELLGNGVLAFTVDQGEYMQRYQGMVQLNGQTLEEAAVHYFKQSEQLPTEIRLSVAELFVPADASKGSIKQWRAGGMIAQFMPSEPERMRPVDLPGGDAPEGSAALDDFLGIESEDDSWTEAKALIRTISDVELTDPDIGAERLLYRLFNQHDPRRFEALPIRDECSCSRERLKDVLLSFTQAERTESVVEGRITVDCEFCSKHYQFTLEELESSVSQT